MSQTHIRVLQAAQYRPWAIHKQALASVIEQVAIRASAIAHMTAVDIDAAVAAASAAPLGKMIGSTAVIPVRGCITQKADFYSWYFGGTSIERLQASFRQYLNDPAVGTIVFDCDSPGGEVYGVPEFFEEIYSARGQKTLIACANPFMASAAYWLCCACDEVYLIPSGQAGSIGCYTVHEDLSKMLERVGIDVTFVQYGEFKTDGNPYEPLSESALEELQASVDHYGSWFDKDVARARGISTTDVKAKFGQGRVFRAPDAKKVGMVDKVATLDEVLARFAPKQRGRSLAADAEPRLTLAAPAAAKKADTVDPLEDGTCPDGYDKGDDGMCHMKDEAAKATADAAVADRAKADHEAILAALSE